MRRVVASMGVAFGVAAVIGGAAAAQDEGRRVSARLASYDETPQTLSTGASGFFTAKVDEAAGVVTWEMTYDGVELFDVAGVPTGVLQSHIHFGRAGLSGGIMVWLCSNLASPPTPAGTQACPTTGGTISGTITAADVVGPAGQGIAAMEFGEFLAAIANGASYVNVHSGRFPGGEIRGQIRHGNAGDK